LFEGGLSLQIRDLGSVSVSLRNLVTIGVLITFLGGVAVSFAIVAFSIFVQGLTITPVLQRLGKIISIQHH